MDILYPKKKYLLFLSLLLNAGHVTTVNLIGNSIFSLLENPQEFKRLQENQNSLIKPAIEETLRYRSPVQFVFRIANDDVTLSAEKIEVGGQKRNRETKNKERSKNYIISGFCQP